MAKKKKEEGGDIPEWVVTYGDLMSLLLCFFILLAAFSELKKPDANKEIMDAVKEAFGVAGGVGRIEMPSSPRQTMPNPVMTENRNLSDSFSKAKQSQETESGRESMVSEIQDGPRFVLGGKLLFEPGSYELSKPNQQRLLEHVAPRFEGKTDLVIIRGHAWGEADLRSGMTLRDLAFERARAVQRFLVEEAGVAQPLLRVETVGSAEPKTVDPEKSDAENRRVEIMLTERPAIEAKRAGG
ncbi:MAG: flagellar motor protein MotB [Planctomycetota bacterium]